MLHCRSTKMYWSKRDYDVEPDGYQIVVLEKKNDISFMPPLLIFIVSRVALWQIFKSGS